MTKYKGEIKQLKHLVASDPHYDKDVWCRYDRTFKTLADWDVDLIIEKEDYYEDYKGKDLHIQGTVFNMLLKNKKYDQINKFTKLIDKDVFQYSKTLEVVKTDIGMDTAQVAFGINKLAKEINEYSKDINNPKKNPSEILNEYNPYFALSTGTDGIFGVVTELVYSDDIVALSINGYIDYDFVDEKDMLNYLQENLKINDLEEIKDEDKEL